MSEVTPTAIETIATASDKAIDASTETVLTAVKQVEAVAKSASAATKIAKPAKKPVVKAARTTKSATAKLPAKRAPKRAAAARSTPVVKASKAVAKRKYVRKPVAAVKPSASPTVSRATPNPFIPNLASPNLFSQGTKIMDSTTFFAPFTSVPGADKFQSLFAGAGEKGQDVVKKGQALAEQMSESAKANLEAVAESGRIAAAGARDLGQEIVASTKGGVEHATAAVKTLTQAKSPTEFFQLQSELVRASFDRFVAEGSKLTEQMVKLAGEASQPLSNRASVNAEKFSELTA